MFSEKNSETMENVLIIQNDPAFIQEEGDLARLVACRHSFSKVPDLMSRRVIFKPYMVDNLDVVSVPVEDDMGDRNVRFSFSPAGQAEDCLSSSLRFSKDALLSKIFDSELQSLNGVCLLI